MIRYKVFYSDSIEYYLEKSFGMVRHRLEGPAIEYTDGHKEWWIDGNKLDEKLFDRIVKLKSFL